MNQKAKKFMERVINTLRDYFGKRLISVVLYGSRSRGDYREFSDYDLFLVIEILPENIVDRQRLVYKVFKENFRERFSLIAKTPDEVDTEFPSFFLDLGLDGRILYDKDFMTSRLQRIREIIRDAGLKRGKIERELSWLWERPPVGMWAIDWDGYHEL